MKDKLGSAIDFLTKILEPGMYQRSKVEKFSTCLLDVLTNHYEDHWFPRSHS